MRKHQGTETFEKRIKRIFYYVGSYGIKKKPIKIWLPDSITDEDKIEFKKYVHQGFRIGQRLMVYEIVKLYKENATLKLKAKEAHLNKDENLKQTVKVERYKIEHRIKIIRHFADFIAWQMFNRQYYLARRFHSGKLERPDLLNTNLESVIYASEHFHRENDSAFALITDLTSYIDIGDLLVIDDSSSLKLVECKSGKEQVAANQLLENIMEENWTEHLEELFKNHPKQKAKRIFDQMQRTFNQQVKATRAVKFFKENNGIDPFSEKEVTIAESKVPLKQYYSELIQAFQESEGKDCFGITIENVIYITIFRNHDKINTRLLFKDMVDSYVERNACVDIMDILHRPIGEPLFFKPLGKQIIFDLIFNRVKLYLALDLNELILLFNEKGFEARWLSKKETNKILDNQPTYKPLIHKNQAIQLKVGDVELTLGSQLVTKLLFDNITPTSFIEEYETYRK